MLQKPFNYPEFPNVPTIEEIRAEQIPPDQIQRAVDPYQNYVGFHKIDRASGGNNIFETVYEVNGEGFLEYAIMARLLHSSGGITMESKYGYNSTDYSGRLRVFMDGAPVFMVIGSNYNEVVGIYPESKIVPFIQGGGIGENHVNVETYIKIPSTQKYDEHLWLNEIPLDYSPLEHENKHAIINRPLYFYDNLRIEVTTTTTESLPVGWEISGGLRV